MTKLVDVLVRLPNLNTLELLSSTHRSPITRALKRKCAKFPSIREMTVCTICPDFMKTCPNLESLTFRHGFGKAAMDPLSLYGPGLRLKRVRGVMTHDSQSVECESPRVAVDPSNHSVRLSYSCSAELSDASGDLV